MSLPEKNIADIRKDYQQASLDEHMAGDNPLAFFKTWFHHALKSSVDEVNAMTLATVDAAGKPHARIVLLKGMDEHGFTFFTNYLSHKGHQIKENQHVALVFFWKELERQIRIEGIAEKVTEAESDEYFHSRPENSRLGAWASPQSQIISERTFLEENHENYRREFSGNIPRPPHWGGYRVKPNCIEFWQGRANRMHDRILFTLNEQGKWDKSRLAP